VDSPHVVVHHLFELLKQSPAKARAAIGTEHVLVPLEPWVASDLEEDTGAVTLTGVGHLVATGAGKQVPVLGVACYPLPLEGPLTVGRTSTAGVVIDQPTVSRIHAEINCVGGIFSVLDKGSYNGTVLNQRVLEQGEALELQNGDVVTFGEAQLVFGDLVHLAKLIEVRRR
jgi:hypothetical protein